MDLQQLRGFFEVAREGSFTRAANKLFVTQPAISQQLKALEAEIGGQLIERRRKSLRLTPAGEILFRRTRSIFSHLDGAIDEIDALKNVMRGTVTIGTSDTNCMYVLPPVLARFRSAFPEVEVVVLNKTSVEVNQLVLDDSVDFGLVTLPAGHRELASEPLFTRQDTVICPPGHALASRRSVSLKTVAAQPVLALEQGSKSRSVMEEAFREAGQELDVVMNLGSVEVIKRFVEIGFGIAMVPKVAVLRELEEGNLAAVSVRGMKPREIGLVFHRSRSRSAATKALVGIAKEELSGSRL
jgi:DNA-binding transcriptional LysR family regulator